MHANPGSYARGMTAVRIYEPAPLSPDDSAIARLRKDRGWSQRSLAKHAGVSWAMIRQLEGGYRPKRSVALARVAAALGVPESGLR